MPLSYLISIPTHITDEQLVLYDTIILSYNFNSLIWLTGLLEVLSTCSCQPKYNMLEKKYSINDNDIVPFLHVSTESQINHKQSLRFNQEETFCFFKTCILSSTPPPPLPLLNNDWWIRQLRRVALPKVFVLNVLCEK